MPTATIPYDPSLVLGMILDPVEAAQLQTQSSPIRRGPTDVDVRYFHCDDEQTSRSTAASISSFVGSKISSLLGDLHGASARAFAHESVTSAYDGHRITGTVVICANCTSEEAQFVSPLVLDPDAAVDAYNRSAASSSALPTDDVDEMRLVALSPSTADDQRTALPIIAGATHGSSFVGFVHLEPADAPSGSPSVESAENRAPARAEADRFAERISRSIGLDGQTPTSVKQLLSTSDIRTHCSAFAIGLAPSVTSNDSVVDLNSLMDALDDHVVQAAAGTTGVPVSLHLDNATREDIATSWLQKHHPDQLHQLTDDGTSDT